MVDLRAFTETALGINLYYLLAGFAGGVVNALRQGHGLLRGLPGTIAGSLTAAYLTPLAVLYLPGTVGPNIERATAFVLGLTGLAVIEGIIVKVDTWRKNPSLPPQRS